MADTDGIERAKVLIAEVIAERGELLNLMRLGLTSLEPLAEDLARATSVKTLNLSGTQITDIAPIAGMTGITTLNLSDTQITDISPIAGMTGITWLNLSGTQITDISPIAGMTGITTLDLSDTQITDISPIAGMTGITWLDLSGTQITDITPIARMPGITTLNLSETQITDISPIAGMTGITTLGLSGTQITDITPIAGMTGITWLDLRSTQITDITPIAGMTGITSLYLSGTQITDITPITGMTRITWLDLRSTQITDITPIAGMTGITSLDLSNTQITDIAPIADLTGITTLDLRNTQITDISPIAGLTGITSLNLRNTQITDLRPIRGLQQLVEDPDLLWDGLTIKHTPACTLDPKIAEIAEVKDNADRARQLFAYLENWVPSGEEPKRDFEEVLRGPILADTLTDLTKPAQQFEATSLSDHPDRDPDVTYEQILSVLNFGSRQLGNTDVQNRLGQDVARSFADYHQFVSQAPLNPRMLRYLAEGIRSAITNEHTVAALDSFDIPRIEGFLAEHDALMNGYFNRSLSPVTFDVETDPDVLANELFPKLDSAKKILEEANKAGLFAPSVSDALEILHRRSEGARKKLFVTNNPEEREAAVAELRRASLLTTAYLGRIKVRLSQWIEKVRPKTLRDGTDDALRLTGLLEVGQHVIRKLTPVFEELWKLIGNLPLPF